MAWNVWAAIESMGNWILDFALIALMFFAALAWGSNEPWAMGVIGVWSFGLLGARLLWDVRKGKLQIPVSWIYLPLLLFLVMAGFQDSVEKHSTIQYLLLGASYVSIIIVVHLGFQSRTEVKFLVIGILTLAAFEALYGLVQYLGDYNYIWDYQNTSGVGLAAGTIINRNHYALLLNLGICAGTGYLFYLAAPLVRGERLSLRRIAGVPGTAKLVWLVLILASMGLALIFSMSRMGMVALIISLSVMILLAHTSQSGKYTAAIGLAVLIVLVGLAVYVGLDPVLARFENISREFGTDKDRIVLWRDAWKMIKKHLWMGQGLGTFQWTYPVYETIKPDIPAKYAHNDYIQALAEVGVVGLALLVWAFILACGAAIKNLFDVEDPLVKGIGLGTLGALTAIALQEITDFGLYIPGVAVLAAVLVGLNLRASRLAQSR
jgi:O-antigen ligase